MKKVKKSTKYEPTLSDVLDAVQNGFSHHEGILNRHEGILNRHEGILNRHGDLLIKLHTGFTRHEKMLTSLHEGQENLREQVGDMGRRLTNTQNRVEDIADMLELDHERRLKRLEQVRK